MAIEKRTSKDGKPAYRVRLAAIHPVTGRRENKTIGTYRTKKEAEKAEREALTAQERGTLVDPKKITVAELLDAWLGSKTSAISSNSHKDYEIAVRRHLKPAFGTL
jgi:integrase